MRGVSLAALFFGLTAIDNSVMAGNPDCVFLNQSLSYCTTLEDGRVSFVGGTPGNVVAVAHFTDTVPERTYFTFVSWEDSSSFESFARENREEFRAGRAVQNTKRGNIGGYPSIRYDYPPGKESEPDFLLVMDTGAGYALIVGSEGDRAAEDVERIVRLLEVSR